MISSLGNSLNSATARYERSMELDNSYRLSELYSCLFGNLTSLTVRLLKCRLHNLQSINLYETEEILCTPYVTFHANS